MKAPPTSENHSEYSLDLSHSFLDRSMAAVTPPLRSDSEDEYQNIDNGPINLAQLDSAQLEARNLEHETQSEDEVHDEQVESSSETGMEEDKEIRRMLREELEKALIAVTTTTATHEVDPNDEMHSVETNSKPDVVDANGHEETERKKKKTKKAADRKRPEDALFPANAFAIVAFMCFIAAASSWNEENKRGIQDTIIREQKETIVRFKAEIDRLNKINNETTGENLRMEPYRSVTLNEWNFRLRSVFVLNVTRGEGIRQGDQIFAVNDVPVKELLTATEVIRMINKGGRPLRLVVRYNPHGLKMITQLLDLQEEWAKTHRVAKLKRSNDK